MSDTEVITDLTPVTDPTLTPFAPPLEYDPDAERWVAERHNPHANASELYAQAEADPGYFVVETDPYQPEEADYTPVPIIASTPDHITPPKGGFPGVEHLDTAYTNYTPQQEPVGQVGLNLTAVAVAGMLGVALNADGSVYSRTPLRQGPGILIGYIITMNGAQTGKFAALVDAEKDDGPVLALINSSINSGGMVSLGHDGIQFSKGLTLIQFAGDPIVIIPVIRRLVPVHLGLR